MASKTIFTEEILERAVDIVATRFKFTETYLSSAKLEDVRIPLNSHGGHRFPGKMGDTLPEAIKWSRKRLSSVMEDGCSPFPCPPYQSLSRMQMSDVTIPKNGLVWCNRRFSNHYVHLADDLQIF